MRLSAHPALWVVSLVACTFSSGGIPQDDTSADSSDDTTGAAPTTATGEPTTTAEPPTGGGDGDADTGDTTDTTTTTTPVDPTTDTTDTTATTDTTGEPAEDPRLVALRTYAPRVWLHPDEQYFPSSVEFAFEHMTRYLADDTNYWIRSTEELDSPSATLPFFAGDLAGAPVYAYYADKGMGVVDLVYFFWYPYNRGKEVVDTIWGNHVGDWEHITVRLVQDAPDQVYLSAHSFGGAYPWAELEKFEDTHPVVYSAKGSHGVWKDPGDHVYMTIGEKAFGVCITLVCADLTDETAPGTAWDTWQSLAAFDFFNKEGLGGQSWPIWMNMGFIQAGEDPVDVPGHGAIYRWGNEENCTALGLDISALIGVCRLEDGPTGPISKNTWGPELQ